MKMLIVGAGQVGQEVARKLVSDHTVHLIDSDISTLDSVPRSIEVTHGDGTELDVLKKAGLKQADVLIVTTNLDQTNIMICNTAKLEKDIFTIARVMNTDYLQTWQKSTGAFGVDLMLGRALQAAENIVRLITYSSRRQPAREMEYFVDNRVQMAVYEVPDGSPLAGNSVAVSDRFSRLTFGAIFRDDKIIFPRGQDTIETGDKVAVIGDPARVKEFGQELNPAEVRGKIEDILLLGGGNFGYQIARQLQKYKVNLIMIEQDEKRARYLAEKLPDVLVLQGDAKDEQIWERENLNQVDLVVGAVSPDCQNLLLCLLAKQWGVAQVLSLVHENAFVDLFEATAIDFVVNPREEMANEIIRYIEVDYAENITSIEHHKGTVYEMSVGKSSPLVGRPLREGTKSLSGVMTIGAIVRDSELITPRGDTVVQPGDRLVILADAEKAEEIAEQVE